MSTWYTGSTLPAGRAPSSGQIELMNEAFSQSAVTASNTYGTVGMFGYEREKTDDCPWGDCQDEYYFYMKFVPFENIVSTSGAVFRMWFQIGQSTSDWHGVEYINSAPPIATDVTLDPVSATEGNFSSDINFDNDSDFRGILYTQNGLYEVVIWRFIPRWEQDETDGSIDRIEKGRVLTCEYDGAISGSSTTQRF